MTHKQTTLDHALSASVVGPGDVVPSEVDLLRADVTRLTREVRTLTLIVTEPQGRG